MTSQGSNESQIIKIIHLKVKTDSNIAGQLLSWFEELNEPPLRDQKIWWQCQTALKEGFDNVVEHAHRDLLPETPIELEAIRSTNTIEIRIWDKGPPFDLEQQLEKQARPPGPNDPIDDLEDHGRGLWIMKKISDRLTCVRTSDGRNCLQIVKQY